MIFSKKIKELDQQRRSAMKKILRSKPSMVVLKKLTKPRPLHKALRVVGAS